VLILDSPDDLNLLIADALCLEIGDVAPFESRGDFRLLDLPETLSPES
jgi:hypothetical protein